MDGTWVHRCGGGAGVRSGIHDEVLGAGVQASAPSKQQKVVSTTSMIASPAESDDATSSSAIAQ